MQILYNTAKRVVRDGKENFRRFYMVVALNILQVGGANSTLIKKTDELHRCQRRDAMTDCPADLLQDPKPIYKIVHDKKPRSIIRPTNNVQLRPQGAILKDLRVGMLIQRFIKVFYSQDNFELIISYRIYRGSIQYFSPI